MRNGTNTGSTLDGHGAWWRSYFFQNAIRVRNKLATERKRKQLLMAPEPGGGRASRKTPSVQGMNAQQSEYGARPGWPRRRVEIALFSKRRPRKELIRKRANTGPTLDGHGAGWKSCPGQCSSRLHFVVCRLLGAITQNTRGGKRREKNRARNEFATELIRGPLWMATGPGSNLAWVQTSAYKPRKQRINNGANTGPTPDGR